MARGDIRVWDPVVRLCHWTLAIRVGVAWYTGEDWRTLHHFAGYTAGVIVALRVLWGLIGPPTARFAGFIRGPRATLGYLMAMARGREARHLGHNPAGGAMIVALLASLAGASLTGWLQTTDAFWGVAWVQTAHELLADLLKCLVVLHLAGVILASRRHRENLALAMVTGRKCPSEAGDMDDPGAPSGSAPAPAPAPGRLPTAVS